MIVSIKSKGTEILINTDAPTELLLKHYETEYLCDTDVLEYISENNYAYDIIQPTLSLDYDN